MLNCETVYMFIFMCSLQIYFLGNDYETLLDLVGKKSLPVEFGGTLPVPFVDGGLIVELLKLFDIYLSSKIS